MRFFATILLLGLLSFTAASQIKTNTTAPKPKAGTIKPKAAAAKPKIPAKPKAAAAPTPEPEMSVTALAAAGYEKLQAGDIAAAESFFRRAVAKAQAPIPDDVFNNTLAKFPTDLYFRGSREGAIEIARTLEEKAKENAGQLLSLAAFYLSVENGSEAKRLAAGAIAIDPASPAAYETLGLANRVDFQLEESAAAYARALELAPDSLTARRGLAEMKRSLGKPDEAIALYREILAKDETVVPARTGLVLAMFDAGNRVDAEAEMARSLEADPGNFILLAGAAYWYAGHREGSKAVDLAQRAIAAEPRFVWSHIALARGYLARNDPAQAEKALLAARRYGNFPTLEYETASAKLAGGYYREAAEELAKSFKVRDGMIETNLGGRVPRASKDITELAGFERRASIFAPTAADEPESAARLTALLELKQEIEKGEPGADNAVRAAGEFIKGDDPMKVHRQIFAAAQLLEKKVALPQVVEIMRAATANVDAGLTVPNASMAVMASELYESRTIAAVRGEYINVPAVPRATLSSILRGRIEEVNGWALYQMSDVDGSVIRLKRAVSVLPPDSAWWRSSTWRLGAALALAGKDAEALDMYIRSYKSGGQSDIRYGTIAELYKRVHGSTDGLEEKLGSNPTVAVATPALVQADEAIAAAPTAIEPRRVAVRTPGTVRRIPSAVPVAPAGAAPVGTPEPQPEPTPSPAETVPEPTPEPPVATLEVSPEPTPEATPESAAEATPGSVPVDGVPDASPEPIPSPVAAESTPESVPSPDVPDATPEPSPTADTQEVVTAIEPLPTPETIPEPTPEAISKETPAAALRAPTPGSTPVVIVTDTTVAPLPRADENKDLDGAAAVKPQARTSLTGNELFPPVVITIPPPPPRVRRVKDPVITPEPSPTPSLTIPTAQPTPAPASEETKLDDTIAESEGRPRIGQPAEAAPVIEPCRLTVSEENIRLQTGGGDIAVIVGLDDDSPIYDLTAVSTSPEDVSVRRETIAGVTTRALFVLRSVSTKTGVYQVRFEMPCGKKEVVVRVR